MKFHGKKKGHVELAIASVINSAKSCHFLISAKMFYFKLVFCTLFTMVHVTISFAKFDFDPSTPIPAFAVSKHLNTSKPRLEIPMIIEYANISMALAPITVQYAIDRLKMWTPFLQDFELQVNFKEGHCADGPTVKEASSILESNNSNILPIIYTTGCAMQAQNVIAEIVDYYNFTTLTLIGVEPRKKRNHYFKLSESHDNIVLSVLTFFQTRNWTKFALIADDHQFFNPVGFF